MYIIKLSKRMGLNGVYYKMCMYVYIYYLVIFNLCVCFPLGTIQTYGAGLSLSSNSMKNGCSQTCLRHGGQPAGKTLIVFQCLKNSMFVLLSHTQTILDVLVHFPRSPEKLEHTQNYDFAQ